MPEASPAENAHPTDPIDPTHRTGVDLEQHAVGQVECPGCGNDIIEDAVACPTCGRKNFVEHPGDMERVKHSPTDLPPAEPDSYGPSDDRIDERQTA